MSKLEDEFILTCGKLEADFHYEKDTGIPRCLIGKYSDDDPTILVKLKDDSVLIQATGDLEVRNIKSIHFNEAEKTMFLKAKSASIYVGKHGYLGGIIE